MDIIENVSRALCKSMQSLVDVAPVKVIIATIMAFIAGDYGIALMAFIMLITIDLTTKWLALSYKYLIDQQIPSEEINLWYCFKAMRKASKAKYITSEMMKTKFAGKILLYMILVITAFHVDIMAGGGGIFLKAVWYYLAATEAVSIVENLRDAGVSSLDPLLTFIRSKLGGLK